MFDYAERRQRLFAEMDAQGVDLIFLPPSADLEYLTGLQRRVMTFGEIGYAHHWVAGGLLARDRDPIFVLPRMIAEFDLPEGAPGEVLLVKETDDAASMFARAVRAVGGRTAGIGARTWGETTLQLLQALPAARVVNAGPLINRLRRVKEPEELEELRRACRMADRAMGEVSSRVRPGVTELDLMEEVNHQLLAQGSRTISFDTGVWQMGPDGDRDADVRVSQQPIRHGAGVSFDFGAVASGYCSDFGRTVHVGEPDDEYRQAYDLVIAAQAAGIAAARPGVTAAEVDAATRQVIEDAGYSKWFRHRTGHCIGLDVHERPYISEEDSTPLEAGMTFTIEPSVFWPGHVGVRIEDIILCTEDGGVKLNEYPEDLAANL